MLNQDFVLRDEGSIAILRPVTDEARAWVDEHIPEDAQWFGGGVVIEHRFANDITAGIEADDLTIFTI